MNDSQIMFGVKYLRCESVVGSTRQLLVKSNTMRRPRSPKNDVTNSDSRRDNDSDESQVKNTVDILSLV